MILENQRIDWLIDVKEYKYLQKSTIVTMQIDYLNKNVNMHPCDMCKHIFLWIDLIECSLDLRVIYSQVRYCQLHLRVPL